MTIKNKQLTQDEIKVSVSRHIKRDRKARMHLINDVIGVGTPVKQVLCYDDVRDKNEIHIVTSTGLILIYDAESFKCITVLVARPKQIKRYYTGCCAPSRLLELAQEHKLLGYHLV